MVIFGIGIAGLPPRDDSPCAVAQTVADGAESKPCRGETRRKLHRLRQDFGGAGKIAARGTLERRAVVRSAVTSPDETKSGPPVIVPFTPYLRGDASRRHPSPDPRR